MFSLLKKFIIILLYLLLVFNFSGCKDENIQVEKINLCKGVDCSNHGECIVEENKAVCNCDEGFIAKSLECIVDLCEDIDCNLHGECVVDKDTEGEAMNANINALLNICVDGAPQP